MCKLGLYDDHPINGVFFILISKFFLFMEVQEVIKQLQQKTHEMILFVLEI